MTYIRTLQAATAAEYAGEIQTAEALLDELSTSVAKFHERRAVMAVITEHLEDTPLLRGEVKVWVERIESRLV